MLDYTSPKRFGSQWLFEDVPRTRAGISAKGSVAQQPRDGNQSLHPGLKKWAIQ
jgi:hypothetical protein